MILLKNVRNYNIIVESIKELEKIIVKKVEVNVAKWNANLLKGNVLL